MRWQCEPRYRHGRGARRHLESATRDDETYSGPDLSAAVGAYYRALAAATSPDAAFDVAMGRFDWDYSDLTMDAADMLASYRDAYSRCGAHPTAVVSCSDCAAVAAGLIR